MRIKIRLLFEFKTASDIFTEALDEPDNQAFLLEKTKNAFSKFFDADIVTCYNDDFPLEKNHIPFIKRIYAFIHFNKIDVNVFYHEDDTIFLVIMRQLIIEYATVLSPILLLKTIMI
ncbi:MAG: hypothetical protein L6U99_09380 [Clostridium sp.]|nr:MAG: hypothetical protein L6U99_09380 [Clostridium sp.]